MPAAQASRSMAVAAPRRARAARGLRAVAAVAATAAAAPALVRVHWEDVYLSPESGLGYGLGVAGLAMMTALLGYSARKRLRWLAGRGSVRTWFIVHMTLGILGPLAILAHSRLGLGSLNGAVALGCTLVVAASGVAGRFVYTRVHHGLGGRRRELVEMREAARSCRGRVLAAAGSAPAVTARLEAVEALVLAPPGGLVRSALRRLAVGRRARALARTARRAFRPRSREAERALHEYLRAVRAAAALTLWERVFSLWHLLHLPLCALLFASAAVHVLAVHMY